MAQGLRIVMYKKVRLGKGLATISANVRKANENQGTVTAEI